MPTIALRYQQASESGFVTTVSIDGQTQYPVTVQDPFTERQERELEFYFEQWIRFPFDNQVIAQRAAASVQTYGESLFEQIFGDRRAYADYTHACSGGLSQIQIEIEGDSPDFQALHWEALKDPDHPAPLSTEAIFTRKRFRAGGTPDINRVPSPVINLLVVTARPDEESDVGYRTISRPLIEAIHRAQLRVKVEILHPGTFQALAEHLEGKAGHYHIIHFDAHGGLMTYDQFEGRVMQDRYLYKARYGRPEMECYTGQRAFLFFEGDSKGHADPVEAQELAALLTAKGIPICILNACQSAKQVKGAMQNAEFKVQNSETYPDPSQAGTDLLQNTETSLGSRLMAAGVQMVVAMGYSVTVTAAQVMMEKLYAELFANRGIPEAIRLSRKELYNRKERKVYFNQWVPLEDWLLPVVYANRLVDLNLREFTAAEEEAYFVAQADLEERYRFPTPTYGFVGRDLEILKIEKSLLRHNVLLLQGMGGTGKTTLLRYLWRWWLTTHFVEDAFYFGYDEKAHTLAQICHNLGKRLYSPEQSGTYARFLALSPAAQEAKLAQTLREIPYLLILDNLESVTGQALAIPNTLPPEEQQRLRQFLLKLVNGKTKVIIGSRSNEAWLAKTYTHAGQAHIYALSGLDPEARTELAEKILTAQVGDRQRITALRMDAEFKRLMALLAGYPLAMEVVLANLARQSPAEILAALNAADVDLNVGGDDKTNNILKCVEYSHSNLSSQAQKLLVFLAPFQNSICVHPEAISNYVRELEKEEDFKEYDFENLDKIIQETLHWGLLSAHEADLPNTLSIQPILPYFLNRKLVFTSESFKYSLLNSFKSHYIILAANCHQLMDSDSLDYRENAKRFCRSEHENLYKALEICLFKKETDFSIYECLDQYFNLTKDLRSRLKLSQKICNSIKDYPSSVLLGEAGYEFSRAFRKLGVCYFQLKEYELSAVNHKEAIRLLTSNKSLTEKERQLNIALSYHELAIAIQGLRDYAQAKFYLQNALDICIENDDKQMLSHILSELGIVSFEMRDYSQAKLYLQEALNCFSKVNAKESKAIAYQWLGSVALELEDFQDAQKYTKQSIAILVEYNDSYSQYHGYNQLGRICLAIEDFVQARDYFRIALEITIRFDDRQNQAAIYHNLGVTSQALREFDQARSHYQQALNIYDQYDDHYSQASTCQRLGVMAEHLKNHEQARSYYQQALDIYVHFNDRHSQISLYGQLGLLAEARQDYKQAQQLFCQGLVICVESEDQHNGEIVLGILAHLYNAIQDNAILTAVAQCLNTTPAEVQELFAAPNL